MLKVLMNKLDNMYNQIGSVSRENEILEKNHLQKIPRDQNQCNRNEECL